VVETALDLNSYLKKKQKLIDTFLNRYLLSKRTNNSCPGYLQKAMAYSLMAGGKRLRAILTIASHESSGRTSKNIVPVAASIELIHTYSLIHDDLPAMDNDDFRRNKPTNHRVFGEAVAILAGDALLTDAFGIISKVKAKPEALIKVIKELSLASGPEGMVGGQTADIINEDRKVKESELLYIHTHKTGALIKASVRIGAMMAGASSRVLSSLTKYGENIGLAYQIVDDILDVVGSREELGKSIGADASRGKNTYPSVFGLEESRRKAESLVRDSLKSIETFDKRADPLRAIAHYILQRRN
jgi:geranylgeranyl diphosphate synthase type II